MSGQNNWYTRGIDYTWELSIVPFEYTIRMATKNIFQIDDNTMALSANQMIVSSERTNRLASPLAEPFFTFLCFYVFQNYTRCMTFRRLIMVLIIFELRTLSLPDWTFWTLCMFLRVDKWEVNIAFWTNWKLFHFFLLIRSLVQSLGRLPKSKLHFLDPNRLFVLPVRKDFGTVLFHLRNQAIELHIEYIQAIISVQDSLWHLFRIIRPIFRDRPHFRRAFFHLQSIRAINLPWAEMPQRILILSVFLTVLLLIFISQMHFIYVCLCSPLL